MLFDTAVSYPGHKSGREITQRLSSNSIHSASGGCSSCSFSRQYCYTGQQRIERNNKPCLGRSIYCAVSLNSARSRNICVSCDSLQETISPNPAAPMDKRQALPEQTLFVRWPDAIHSKLATRPSNLSLARANLCGSGSLHSISSLIIRS